MKYLNQLLALVLTAIFMGNSIAQTIKTIPADSVSVGLPGSSQNPTIKLDTGYIRKNKTSGKMEFSHDGTLAKVFGTGSGSGDGGAPINDNPSFEDGVTTGYTYSGSSFTPGTYTNGIEGDLKFATFTASAAGQYFETTLKAIPDFSNGGCLAKIDYNSTDASGTWKIQVYDSSSNLLKEQSLDSKAWQPGYAPFQCPTAGTQIKMRVISTAAGTIQTDRGYLGKENRTFQVAQARLAGESYFIGTTGCSWARTSTSVGSFAATTACPGPTITVTSMGQWDATDTDLPKQTVANLPAGIYKAKFYASHVLSAANSAVFAISDGTTTCEPTKASDGAVFQPQTIVECSFSYASAGTRSFELVAASAGGTINVYNNVNAAPRGSLKFILEFWPSDSQTALRPESQDWIVDVNIGGGSAAISASNSSTYVSLDSATLDLVVNSGSASALIPCSGTNSATGLTCSSGSEEPGAVINVPQAGFYEACYESTLQLGPSGQGTLEIVETPVNAQTILQEGKSRSSYFNSNGSLSSFVPVRSCGTFYFASAGQKALRIMMEASAGGLSNTLVMDRDASNGQRDLHLVVRPLLNGFNRPYLTGDQITTPGVTNPKIHSFRVSSTGTVTDQIGNLVTGSCVVSGTSIYTCPILSTGLTIVPLCTITADVIQGDNIGFSYDRSNSTTSNLRFGTKNAGSGAVLARDFIVTCHTK